MRTLAQAEVQRPFDLARGPLLHATLVHLAADEHMLILTMHHIISDGWSHGMFWRELACTLRSMYGWKALTAPSALDPVCGFCPLAAAVATGRGAGHATCLLEAAAYWGVLVAVAHGSPAPARANLSGCPILPDHTPNVDASAQGPEPAAWGDFVHDTAGGLPDFTASLYWSG